LGEISYGGIMKGRVLSRYRFWFVLLFVVVVLILLRVFVVEFVFISGDSMFPTLHDAGLVVVSQLKKEPARGEIIVFREHDMELVKRVVGLPGELVEIRQGCVYVDGQALDAANSFPCSHDGSMPATRIPDGCVFVLGDNRDHSRDSRMIGPVKIESIDGYMLFVVW
jgi:signal peptidase I